MSACHRCKRTIQPGEFSHLVQVSMGPRARSAPVRLKGMEALLCTPCHDLWTQRAVPSVLSIALRSFLSHSLLAPDPAKAAGRAVAAARGLAARGGNEAPPRSEEDPGITEP